MNPIYRYLLCALLVAASVPLPNSVTVVCLSSGHVQLAVAGNGHRAGNCRASTAGHEDGHHGRELGTEEHADQHLEVAGNHPECVTPSPCGFCLDLHIHAGELLAGKLQLGTPLPAIRTSGLISWDMPDLRDAHNLSILPVEHLEPWHLPHLRTVQIRC